MLLFVLCLSYTFGQNVLINSVDTDQTAPKEQSDQGLHCLVSTFISMPPYIT